MVAEIDRLRKAQCCRLGGVLEAPRAFGLVPGLRIGMCPGVSELDGVLAQAVML